MTVRKSSGPELKCFSFGCDVFSGGHDGDGNHEVHRKITRSTKVALKAKWSYVFVGDITS